MSELKERFALADEISTRDLWAEARRRAAAPEAPRALEWPPALGRRLAAATAALAVFATVVVFAWETFQGDIHPDPGPAVGSPPAPDATGEVTKIEPFVPPTETVGNDLRMPVVFPDGSRATLVYPLALDLATLGVQPDLSYVWQGYFPIVFIHGPDASIDPFVDPEGPVRLVNSSAGGLEIWRARGNDVDQRFWIRFELPSWTVLVSVRDALEDALTVAGALELTETDSGFPLIQASGPVTLAEGFGEAGGAQLGFGDGTAEPSTVSQLDAMIFLSPDGCTSATDGAWAGGYGSTCLGDGSVFASIYGDREFVTSVIAGLRVEDFRQA